MKFLASCFAFLLVINSIGFAQSDKSLDEFEGFNNAVYIVPQYTAISGIRVDYERKLKDSKQWLLFAPQIYLDNDGNDEYYQMTGFGMNVYYKLFLVHSKKKNENGLSRTTVYFSAGPTFQHFSLQSIEEVPDEFTEEGITYIRFNTSEVTTKINKFGANANFGLQFTFDRFIIDFYGGVGVRYALDSDGDLMDYYNDNWLDYGYSGILLDGGVRLGFFIP